MKTVKTLMRIQFLQMFNTTPMTSTEEVQLSSVGKSACLKHANIEGPGNYNMCGVKLAQSYFAIYLFKEVFNFHKSVLISKIICYR